MVQALMLFKALTVFSLGKDFIDRLNGETLAAKAAEHAFRPCGPLELASAGWVPPLGRRATELVHAVNGMLLLSLGHDERLLPAAVIRQQLDERVNDIEDSEGRRVGRRERAELQERIVLELMPQAFTRQRRTLGYFDPPNAALVVNSTVNREVDAFLAQLRETLGSLPAVPLATAHSPSRVMTGWLMDSSQVPRDVLIEGECELEHDGVIRCREQDLTGQEIHAHLVAGKQVRKLALTWNERLALVLADDLTIRRLRFLELVQEELQDVETDTPEARMDAEFVIASGEIRALIPRLTELFGGLQAASGADAPGLAAGPPTASRQQQAQPQEPASLR
jgi:recombination associated protein RdgC